MPLPLNNFDKFSHGYSITINPEKIDRFMELLSEKDSIPQLVNLFDNHLDEMAICAGTAFSMDKITSMQLTTLLNLRSYYAEAIKVTCHQALDSEGTPDEELQKQINRQLSRLQQKQFMELLATIPSSELYFFKIILLNPDNERLQALLGYAEGLGLIRSTLDMNGYPMKVYRTILTFSASIRQAFMKSRYGIHAKEAFPVPGIISIDEMNQFMLEGFRPISVAYPGIQNPEVFHGIKASQFYLSLHDEIHHVLISTIPNDAFYALQYAINRIRDITGFRWSKELWTCLDMDVSTFLNESLTLYFHELTPKKSTRIFIKLLFTGISTEGGIPSGLFNASALNDTMWLFLLDLHFNPELWKGLSIDPAHFKEGSPYKLYYDFIITHQDLLKTLAPATQVAYIKSAWFQLPWVNQSICRFSKVKPYNYIQVEQEGSPVFASKLEYFSVIQLEMQVNQFDSCAARVQELFITNLLRDITVLLRLTNMENQGYLQTLIRAIPEKSEAIFLILIQSLFHSPLKNLKEYSLSVLLKNTLLSFPEKKNQIFQLFKEKILTPYDTFHTFFISFSDIYNCYYNLFSENTDELFQAVYLHILKSPKGLKKIFNHVTDFNVGFFQIQLLFSDKQDEILEAKKFQKKDQLSEVSLILKSSPLFANKEVAISTLKEDNNEASSPSFFSGTDV